MKFCAGNFLLDNAPRSDIPVEADKIQMKILIDPAGDNLFCSHR